MGFARVLNLNDTDCIYFYINAYELYTLRTRVLRCNLFPQKISKQNFQKIKRVGGRQAN